METTTWGLQGDAPDLTAVVAPIFAGNPSQGVISLPPLPLGVVDHSGRQFAWPLGGGGCNHSILWGAQPAQRSTQFYGINIVDSTRCASLFLWMNVSTQGCGYF